MEKTNKITTDELVDFLEGSLTERREKEVANAIDSDEELQERIQALMDINDIMLFHAISAYEIEEKRNTMTNFKYEGDSYLESEKQPYRIAAETMKTSPKEHSNKPLIKEIIRDISIIFLIIVIIWLIIRIL